MAAGLFDRFQVIDVDTHVTEPRDVWTSRVSKKWGDLVPHVVPDPEGGPKEFWAVGDEVLMGVGISAHQLAGSQTFCILPQNRSYAE